MRKQKTVDFVDDFEMAFSTVAMYLIMALSKEKPDISLEGANKVFDEHFKDRSLSQMVADALNRIDRLRIIHNNKKKEGN